MSSSKPSVIKEAIQESSELASSSARRGLALARRRGRGWGSEIGRLLKLVAWMVGAAVVIPTAMISLGLLLGPRGYEGVVLAPLAVLTSWALILFLGLRRKVTVAQIKGARVSQLPARAALLIEQRKRSLPVGAHSALEQIQDQLEQLQIGVQALDEQHPGAFRLRRLLVKELGGLLASYEKLPAHLRSQPLHGGASPAEQLTEGVRSIQFELKRVQDELAADDLFALATQQRYLEMKYGKSKGDDR